jgi:hypothetical protein
MEEAMTDRRGSISPQLYARIAGAAYLFIIVSGVAGAIIKPQMIVPGDPATTAANIVAGASTLRLVVSIESLHMATGIALAVLLYALFKPVDRYVSLLAALTHVACAIVLAVAAVGTFAALRLTGTAGYLSAVDIQRRNSLAMLAIRLQEDMFAIGLVFFAFTCLALGYLVFRSGFLPRAIGVLLFVAAGAYILNSFAHILSPPRAAQLVPGIFVPIFIAELSLALWLTVKGVNREEWDARAAAAGVQQPWGHS